MTIHHVPPTKPPVVHQQMKPCGHVKPCNHDKSSVKPPVINNSPTNTNNNQANPTNTNNNDVSVSPINNNNVSNQVNPTATANNSSEVNIDSRSSIDLSSFNVSQDNTTTFFNGSALPTATFNIFGNSDLSRNHVVGVNLSVPLGTNKARVLSGLDSSEYSMKVDNCTKLASVGLTSLECSDFKPINKITNQPEASNELMLAKQSIEQYLNELRDLRRTNEALQLRIIQMQHQPITKPTKG